MLATMTIYKDDAARIEAAEADLVDPFVRLELLIGELDDDIVRDHISDSVPKALERLARKLRAKMGDCAW
jgi:hypothetical protein